MVFGMVPAGGLLVLTGRLPSTGFQFTVPVNMACATPAAMNSEMPRVRLRRLRENRLLAESLREVSLEPRQLVLPLFVVPGTGVRNPIPGLPWGVLFGTPHGAGRSCRLVWHNQGGRTTESVRGGIISVAEGQTGAAHALGMSRSLIMLITAQGTMPRYSSSAVQHCTAVATISFS